MHDDAGFPIAYADTFAIPGVPAERIDAGVRCPSALPFCCAAESLTMRTLLVHQIAKHMRPRWNKFIKDWVGALKSTLTHDELLAELKKHAFIWAGVLGSGEDWGTLLGGVTALGLGSGRESFSGSDLLACDDSVLDALANIIQAASELLPEYVVLKALFGGRILGLRGHGDWYGPVAMHARAARTAREQGAALQAAGAAPGGDVPGARGASWTGARTATGTKLARLLLRFGVRRMVGRWESIENIVDFPAVPARTTSMGGAALQPPSAGGRQVVDLPIPAAGAYIYDNEGGTLASHAVLDLGADNPYIVVDIEYPADKDLIADMRELAAV